MRLKAFLVLLAVFAMLAVPAFLMANQIIPGHDPAAFDQPGDQVLNLDQPGVIEQSLPAVLGPSTMTADGGTFLACHRCDVEIWNGGGTNVLTMDYRRDRSLYDPECDHNSPDRTGGTNLPVMANLQFLDYLAGQRDARPIFLRL